MNDKTVSDLELEVSDWLNTETPLSLSELKGKVVAIHFFQMLCPGCVVHGLPQTTSIYRLYDKELVQVIGVHSVFEHHDVMTKEALMAFIQEYNLQFPIAIDMPSENDDVPKTMKKFKLQGTPSLILIDQQGRKRLNYFGRLSDMEVGNAIGRLLNGNTAVNQVSKADANNENQCDDKGCTI